MTHMKASASEEHIANALEIKNALNAIFLAMMGSPSFPASVMYPPGKVMRIATTEVLPVYV